VSPVKAIQSELIKLKYPPILWLIVFVIFTTLIIVFSAHYLGIHTAIRLGVNPWLNINSTGQAIFSMFIGTPFVILLISTAIFIENQNQGFKQLYTLPKGRASLTAYKLITIFLILFFTLLFLIIGLIATGYFLNIIYPETEFTYYKLPFFIMIKTSVDYIISTLGVIGIQYFLSIRFRGFLVSASFGILAYILSFILVSVSSSLALYLPYSYSMITMDNGAFNLSSIEIDQYGILNEVQLYSILAFIILIFMSLYLEKNRNI